MISNFNEENQTLISEWKQSTDESVKLVREEMDTRLEELRKFLEMMNERVLRRVEVDKFEDYKKYISVKLDTEALKVKDLERKVGPFDKKFELLQAELDTRIKDLLMKLNAMELKLDRDLKEFELRIKTSGSNTNQFSSDSELMIFLKKQFACDAHQPATEGGQTMERLKQLEEDNIKIKNDQRKIESLLLALQEDISNKIDLHTFSMQIGKTVSKDELVDLLKPLQQDEERNKKLHADMQKIKKKLKETIDFVENKIKEFKKDFDMAHLLKLLKCKAEEKDVKGQFKSVQDAMAEYRLILDDFKKQFDDLLLLKKKVSQLIMLVQGEDASTLASSKLLCLSCGRGSKFAPELKQVLLCDPGHGQGRQHVLRRPGQLAGHGAQHAVRPGGRCLQHCAVRAHPQCGAPPRAVRARPKPEAAPDRPQHGPQPIGAPASAAVFE